MLKADSKQDGQGQHDVSGPPNAQCPAYFVPRMPVPERCCGLKFIKWIGVDHELARYSNMNLFTAKAMAKFFPFRPVLAEIAEMLPGYAKLRYDSSRDQSGSLHLHPIEDGVMSLATAFPENPRGGEGFFAQTIRPVITAAVSASTILEDMDAGLPRVVEEIIAGLVSTLPFLEMNALQLCGDRILLEIAEREHEAARAAARREQKAGGEAISNRKRTSRGDAVSEDGEEASEPGAKRPRINEESTSTDLARSRANSEQGGEPGPGSDKCDEKTQDLDPNGERDELGFWRRFNGVQDSDSDSIAVIEERGEDTREPGSGSDKCDEKTQDLDPNGERDELGFWRRFNGVQDSDSDSFAAIEACPGSPRSALDSNSERSESPFAPISSVAVDWPVSDSFADIEEHPGSPRSALDSNRERSESPYAPISSVAIDPPAYNSDNDDEKSVRSYLDHRFNVRERPEGTYGTDSEEEEENQRGPQLDARDSLPSHSEDHDDSDGEGNISVHRSISTPVSHSLPPPEPETKNEPDSECVYTFKERVDLVKICLNSMEGFAKDAMEHKDARGGIRETMKRISEKSAEMLMNLETCLGLLPDPPLSGRAPRMICGGRRISSYNEEEKGSKNEVRHN